MNKDLLIIFTRNIELGKCKTRLAKTIGHEKALDIYKFLVEHTAVISRDISADKWVFYSEAIEEKDLFDKDIYRKFIQEGEDLGTRMDRAFAAGFQQGYERIIIIGSDIYDLDRNDIEDAFDRLNHYDYVVGPAQDGGYYLLGMCERNSLVFQNKSWGTDSVLKETLEDLKSKNVIILATRNDVDVYEDIAHVPEFQRFLRN